MTLENGDPRETKMEGKGRTLLEAEVRHPLDGRVAVLHELV